jgi:aspartate racemase
MSEKIVGMLGGMGPEATLDCFGKLLRSTRAAKDQEHLRVLIDSNSKVPDRTAAILGKGPSPVPELVASANGLARAGADFLIIPCVSAHMFLDEVQRQVAIPIVSMLDIVAEALGQLRPPVRTVGLLATSGTVTGGAFQRRLARDGIQTLVPAEAGQARVMAAIYDVKNAKSQRPRAAITSDLVEVAGTLLARGAQAIVAGCTEIPLALSQEDLEAPYVDSVLALARAAVVRAGGRLA